MNGPPSDAATNDLDAPSRAQAAIDAERRLELLTRDSRDVLCELCEGVVTFVSGNVSEVTGRRENTFLGRAFAEVIHPDDVATYAPFFAPGWTGAIDARVRIADTSGAWHWREARGTRVIDDEGHHRAVILLHDVSEAQRVEHELEHSESRSRALLAAIPDLMFRIGRDGTYLDFNAEQRDDFYRRAEVFVGANIRDVLPLELAGRKFEAIERVLDHGGVEILEYQLERKGEIREYESRITACGEDEVVVICRDTTERARVMTMLRDGAAWFRCLTASSPVGIFQTDIAGRCHYTNERWRETTGMTEQEAMGDGWAAAIHPDDAEEVFAAWSACMAEEREFGMEFRFVDRAGVVKWVMSRASTLRSDAGVVVGYVGTTEDISDRRQAARDVQRTQERAAILGERARIAQELHDNVAQFFFGIGIAAKEMIEHKPFAASTLRRRLVHIRKLSADGGREIRNAIQALSATEFADGLEASIERLVRGYEGAWDGAEFDSDLGMAVPHECATELYAAAREALYNVRKHASATNVRVRLHRVADEIVLDVIDDGAGSATTVASALADGLAFGLRSMRARIAARGGRIELSDTSGGGLTIRFILPLAARQRAA